MLSNRLERAILTYAKTQKDLRHELRKSNKNQPLPAATITTQNQKNKNRFSPYFSRADDDEENVLPSERKIFLKNRQKKTNNDDEELFGSAAVAAATSKVIVIGDDDEEEEEQDNDRDVRKEQIGLKPGQYQVNIPGLDRENPFPLQFPDGRRNAEDTDRYSEEWFEKEEIRRDTLVKNKDYNFMKLFAGYIGNLTVEQLYTFRDTEVAERRIRERLFREQTLDRLRIRELEKAFAHLPQVHQFKELYDSTIVRLQSLTNRFATLSQDRRLENLIPNSESIEAINRFLMFVDEWQKGFPVWLATLKDDGELQFDEVNKQIIRMGGIPFLKDFFKGDSVIWLETSHKLVISTFLELNNKIAGIVVPIYESWAKSAQVEPNINETLISLFNVAFGPILGGIPRNKIEGMKTNLMAQNKFLRELETERQNIQKELEYTTERQQEATQQLILALQRQGQIQKEIEEILTRRDRFNEMSIQWMDRPENSGKFEINEKAAAAINKAYAIISGFFASSPGFYMLSAAEIPSLSAFMNSQIVRNQFANLAYLYYYLDGLPRRYLPASEIPQKKADVEHLLEFFRDHVIWDPTRLGFIRKYNGGRQDEISSSQHIFSDTPYQPKYFSPVW